MSVIILPTIHTYFPKNKTKYLLSVLMNFKIFNLIIKTYSKLLLSVFIFLQNYLYFL